MKSNLIKFLVSLLLIALLYIAYDKNSQSLKLSNITSFMQLQSADESAISEQINKVYNEFFRGVYADNPTNLPFYNANLSTSFAALYSPLMTMASSASFAPSNIKVLKFIDSETALVSYTLNVTSNDGAKGYPMEMEVHKIAGVWLLDSETFLPERSTNIANTNETTESKPVMPKESTFQQIKSEFSFDDKNCIINGTIDTIIRYGAPDYGESPDTDEKLTIYVIRTKFDLNIKAMKHSADEEPAPEFSDYDNLNEFQLVSNESLKKYRNQTVTLKGSFFPGHNAHHYTDVLFQIDVVIDNASN